MSSEVQFPADKLAMVVFTFRSWGICFLSNPDTSL